MSSTLINTHLSIILQSFYKTENNFILQEGHCLPFKFNDVANFIRNDMIVYPDDVWIVTPPKCGTTWMQEIVWHIHTDVDLAKAQLNQFYRQGISITGHSTTKRTNFTHF